MRNLNQTGLLAGNIVGSFPSTGNMSVTMPDNFEDLSREQLIARLNAAEDGLHPNSVMSLLTMDGRETHKHAFKTMNPIQIGTAVILLFVFLIVVPWFAFS